MPALNFTGTPSSTAGAGFLVRAGPAPGGNLGLFLYTTFGAQLNPLQTAFGSLCVGAPFKRIAAQFGGGTAGLCNGQYQLDCNAYAATQPLDPQLHLGAQVDVQAWYREPPNPGGANLTEAARFTLCE